MERTVGDIEVGVETDRSAMDRVTSSIAEMGSESRTTSRSVTKLGTSLAGATLHSKLLNFTIVAVGAAIPLVAVAAGVATGAIGGLASIAAVAASGLGAFALAAAGNVAKVNEVRDEVKKLNEQLRDTDDAEKRAELIKERTRLLNELTPAQRSLARSINEAERAWNNFLDTTSQSVSGALTSWIKTVEPGLKAITPLVEEVAAAVKGLGTTFRLDLQGGFLGDFISFLEGKAGPTVRKFGGIFRNAFKGITGIIEAFWPLGQDILDWLVGASKSFAEWGQTLKDNKQFQAFVDWVREAGPQFLDLMTAVGELVLEVGKSIAQAFTAERFGAINKSFIELITLFTNLLTETVKLERGMRTFGNNIPGIVGQIGGAWGLIKSALVAPVRTARTMVIVQLNQLAINALGVMLDMLGGIVRALAPLPGNMEAPFRVARRRIAGKMTEINADSQRQLTNLNSTVQSKMNGIPPRFTSAWQKARGRTSGGLRNIRASAGSGAQGVVNSQDRVRTGVPRKHRQGWNSAESATRSGKSGVVNEASTVPGLIVTAFAGLSPRMFSIGVSIMSGLQSGIQSMIGAVTSAASAAASSAAAAARGELGIESPSKVFEHIGRQTGQGLALGLDRSRPMVTNAAAGMLGSAAAVSAAGTGQRPLTGDVNINTGRDASARELVDELSFELRRRRRGGVMAGA